MPRNQKQPIKRPRLKKKGDKHKKRRGWDDSFYVASYELARSGSSNTQISQVLGVDQQTYFNWIQKKPALKEALEKARNEKGNASENFIDFMYGRLPEHLKDFWDDLESVDSANTALARLEAMEENQGKRVRQHLFLYALVDSNFNISEACRRVGITRQVYEKWKARDGDFLEMIEEIREAKKDFFETGLLGLVAAGNPAATIFANKTQNRDRGYGDKLQVEHSGSVEQKHLISLEDLRLPLELRAELLKYMEQAEQRKLGYENKEPEEVIDAEFSPVQEEKKEESDGDFGAAG